MKHAPFPQPFADDLGIGQHKVAKHRAEVAFEEMARTARVLLESTYVPDLVLVNRAQTHRDCRAEYDRAIALMEMTDEQAR